MSNIPLIIFQCRQQAYDWRRGFLKAANAAVTKAIDLRRANTKLSPEERADHGLYQWVCNATKPGGEAMFGQPNIAEPDQAKELLQSSYVVQAVAYHFKSIVGTINVDRDPLTPVGAIALAAAAVERAFRWHVDGKPKGLPHPKFNRLRAGPLTGEWRDTGVQDLLDHPNRMESLLDRALAPLESELKLEDTTELSQGTSTRHSLYRRERSSSPAAGGEDM
ncbi:hypothetical protein LXA43DRAFT_893224 [Ganoderma leucocontextum]|nr:hypothetical protein LXA43DRAFT_902158 [Ganoderma leucocontextum]KAI1789249.1 hypothetical protein LXA43DRAFT_893224 [Ganoderma leucocontextum]